MLAVDFGQLGGQGCLSARLHHVLHADFFAGGQIEIAVGSAAIAVCAAGVAIAFFLKHRHRAALADIVLAVHQLDLRAGRIGRVILQLGARVAHRFGGVERNLFFNHQLLQLLVEPRQIGFQAGNIQIVAAAVAFGEAAFLFNQGNGFGRHHIRICALQRNGLAAAQHQRACRNHQSFHFISPIGLLFFRRPVQPCVWP